MSMVNERFYSLIYQGLTHSSFPLDRMSASISLDLGRSVHVKGTGILKKKEKKRKKARTHFELNMD